MDFALKYFYKNTKLMNGGVMYAQNKKSYMERFSL